MGRRPKRGTELAVVVGCVVIRRAGDHGGAVVMIVVSIVTIVPIDPGPAGNIDQFAVLRADGVLSSRRMNDAEQIASGKYHDG